jgi:hypothetical protein
MTAPTLVPDLDEATYHADTDTLSASGAKVLLGRRPPSPDSDALRFGTLLHRTVLEPDRLDEYAVLDPETVGVLKDGSPAASPTSTAAWKTAVAEAEKAGKTVVLPADVQRAQAMAAAVNEHPTAARIIAMATDYELSAYADHPSGARVRARFDLAGPIIGDLKTSRHADPAAFGRFAHDLGYHISAANYLDIATACGMAPVGFAFINVEKEPTPGGAYRVSVTELTPAAIDLGRRLMAEACRRWLALGKRIDLPSYGDGFTTVDLPPWAYTEAPTLEETAA